MRALLLGVLLALSGLGLTQDVAGLEAEIASYEALLEARNADLEAIEAVLEDTSADLSARIAERETVSAQVRNLQLERQHLHEQITLLNGQLAATRSAIAETDARLAELRLRVSGLLESLYRQRGGGGIAGVLRQAESFHDVQVKNYFLSLLSEQDVSLINDFNRALEELAVLQSQYGAQLAELTAREATLAANEAALAAKRDELNALIAELNTSREGQLANQGAALREQAAFEERLGALNRNLQDELARLAQLEEERRAREAAEAARAAAQATAAAAVAARGERRAPPEEEAETEDEVVVPQLSDLPPLSSGYTYPVPDPQLLRRYGEARSSGIWLRTAQEGAAVHAVQPGIVLEVGPALANQGYIVAIRHDEGLVTAYVNLQAVPPVRVGQAVSQDQIIGYLGGGGAIPPDVLEFYTGWTEGSGVTWVDPAGLLGF